MTDTPRTAAGRALLHDFTNGYIPEGSSGDKMKDRILAIEAEASTLALDAERLARAYERLSPGMDPGIAGEFAADLAAAYASGSEAVEHE